MFEQEIENIIQNTQAKTIGNGSSIRVADILSAPILPAIKTFFQTEVEGVVEGRTLEPITIGTISV